MYHATYFLHRIIQHSRDFPFWEYRYLPLMKAIIERSGVKMPVKMLNAGQSGKELQFQLQSTGSFKGTLEVVFKSMDRHCDGKSVKALSLAKGKQQITLPLPQLPGGTHIAHIRILNSKGGVCDAGAIKVTTPEIAAVKVEFAKADRCYSFKAPVNFTVKSAKFLNSDKLVVRIEDSEFREVFRAEKKAAAELPFTLKLHAPFTTLNRVIAELYRNGKLISRNMGEFSFSDRTLDPTDYHAGMWGGRPQLTPMLRNLGFDLFSGSSLRNNIETGYMRNLITQGFFPLMLNFGAVAVPRNASRTYRGDVATDPVRVPCYSDPVFTKKADDLIKQHAETNQMRYYTCIYHHLGDEMFLGSTVCFSEHCLKNFRAEMQKQYKTIANLNAVWGRNYKSFDEVTPVQRKEMDLMDSDGLGAFACLDVDVAIPADREVELRNLVCLRKVGIEIVLTVELVLSGDLAVEGESRLDGKFNYFRVELRKRSGHSRAHFAHMGIGRASELRRAPAEDLRFG